MIEEQTNLQYWLVAQVSKRNSNQEGSLTNAVLPAKIRITMKTMVGYALWKGIID